MKKNACVNASIDRIVLKYRNKTVMPGLHSKAIFNSHKLSYLVLKLIYPGFGNNIFNSVSLSGIPFSKISSVGIITKWIFA